MSLRFILGRAGSGKTNTCLEEIRQKLRKDPRGVPLLLVPEQATFQMEYALLCESDLAGIMRGGAWSFKRLSWKILEEQGEAGPPAISETGKQMLVKSLLLQNKEELRLFFRAAREPGFLQSLCSVLAEFKIYGVTQKDLHDWQEAEEEIRGKNSTLAAKIHDLALLYDAYQDTLAKQGRDSEDCLELAAGKVKELSFFRGCRIWVDSFTGFTPQEYRFLRELLKISEQINVALCLDPRKLEAPLLPSELFHQAKETYLKLLNLAGKENIPVEDHLILGCPGDGRTIFPRFSQAPDLAYLEEKWLEDKPQPYPERPPNVNIWQAANRRSEVEAAAREILHLCREEKYRMKDIAVLVRDLEVYEPFITTVFDDYGLPYFLDRKKPVHQHPLVELVRSALEIVTADWAPEPVLRFIKTDLAGLHREEVDVLENYVLEHGLRGSFNWLREEPWRYYRQLTLEKERDTSHPGKEELLAKVHKARLQVTRIMGPFYRKFKKCCQKEQVLPAKVTALLYDFMEQLDLQKQLQKWQDRDEKKGFPGLAREHRQAWNGVIEVLEQVFQHLGEKEMTLGEYVQVVQTGLEGLRLGQIPPALDQVLVGQVDRSRQPPLKAAFVLGVNEGSFPNKTREDDIFSDRERQMLAKKGQELAPDSRQRLFHEQYQCYIALTRASRYLYVSYPMADEEGQALLPSPVMVKIKDLFPQLQEGIWPAEPNGQEENQMHYLAEPRSSRSLLLQQLRFAQKGQLPAPPWRDYYQLLVREKTAAETLDFLRSPLNYSNKLEPLPPSLIKDFFSGGLGGSISRLEQFAACPFSHYARYWLGLQKRPLYRLEAPGMGVFYHAALKEFVEQLQKRSITWGDLKEEQALEILREVLAKLIPRLQGEILLSSSRYRYLAARLEKVLQRALLLLGRQARQSRFRPEGLEVEFGKDKELPPLTIKARGEKEMNIYGRIDRLDALRQGDKCYVQVIDYKSRVSLLHLSDFYDGLNLQLLAYLQAALKGYQSAGVKPFPAGAFYFGITSEPKAYLNPLSKKEAVEQLRRRHRLEGLLLEDQDLIKLMDNNFDGQSDFLPVRLNKDGNFSKDAATVKYEDFRLLFSYLDNMLEKLFSRLAQGRIDVAPYYKRGETPCKFCDYKTVCRFEGDTPEGGEYRFFSKKNNAETMKAIRCFSQEGEEDNDR